VAISFFVPHRCFSCMTPWDCRVASLLAMTLYLSLHHAMGLPRRICHCEPASVGEAIPPASLRTDASCLSLRSAGGAVAISFLPFLSLVFNL